MRSSVNKHKQINKPKESALFPGFQRVEVAETPFRVNTWAMIGPNNKECAQLPLELKERQQTEVTAQGWFSNV